MTTLAHTSDANRPAAYNEGAKPSREYYVGKLSRQVWFLIAVLAASAGVAGYLAFGQNGFRGSAPEATASRLTLNEIPFNGARAYQYLEQICAIGRRMSGTPGMQQQQALLEAHFQKLGAVVERQSWRVRHPQDGSPVALTNLIVHWHPEARERILLCAHYDTRPYPDRDPVSPRGTFIGANDGASGVALLMELGHEMASLEPNYGVDFVFFDAEEFIFEEGRDNYFLGSTYFARDYIGDPPPYRYRWAVLLDMVADADLQIYYERNTMGWADSRPLVESIWQTAARLGVSEFVPRKKHRVRDDHLPLHNTARIPSCDIIDFDYPHWHTTADLPEQCSALSLAKVGWVVREWLANVR